MASAPPATAGLLPVVCLLAVGGLLGATANLAKVAVAAGLPPLTYIAWPVLGAGAVLLAVARAAGQPMPTTRPALRYAVFSGLLSVAAPNALMFSALPHVGAGFAALSLAFPPLFTYLMALALRLERPRTGRALGVASGLAGAGVLAVAKWNAGDAPPLWIAAIIATPVIIAAGNIYRTLRWPAGATSLSLAPGMLVASGVMLVPLSLLAATTGATPPLVVAGFLLAVQTVVFATLYTLYFVLQKIAGPVYLSQIGSVAAIVGTALAVLVLGEAPPPALAASAVLIAIGVVLVTASPAAPRRR